MSNKRHNCGWGIVDGSGHFDCDHYCYCCGDNVCDGGKGHGLGRGGNLAGSDTGNTSGCDYGCGSFLNNIGIRDGNGNGYGCGNVESYGRCNGNDFGCGNGDGKGNGDGSGSCR